MREFGNWQSGCVLDESSWFRYQLWRRWVKAGRMVCFIGVNPSTATHEAEDATTRRWTSLARKWGYDGFWAVNLYAYRETKADALKRAGALRGWLELAQGPALVSTQERLAPEHPNDLVIRTSAQVSSLVVGCWGALRWPDMGKRVREVVRLVQVYRPVHAIAVTKDGQPGHVLRKRAELAPWIPPAGLGLGEPTDTTMTEQSGSPSSPSDAGTVPHSR